MLGVLKKFINKQQFHPGILGVFFNPFYISRSRLLNAIKTVSPSFSGGTIVDIGCGIKPYKDLFDCDKYYGVEIKGGGHEDCFKHCDIFYDGNEVPLLDSSADFALSTQVLEHTVSPELYLSEVNRVLKPGGRVLLSIPFAWDEHEKPYDFWRFSSFGIKSLLESKSFTVIETIKVESYIESIFQLFSNYIYTKLTSKNKYFNLFIYMTFCSTVQLLGIFLSKILPSNDDFYLNLVVVAEKK